METPGMAFWLRCCSALWLFARRSMIGGTLFYFHSLESVRNGDVLMSRYGSREGEEERAGKGYSSVRHTGDVYPAKVVYSRSKLTEWNMLCWCMLLSLCLLVEYQHTLLFLFNIIIDNMWIFFCIFAIQTNHAIFI